MSWFSKALKAIPQSIADTAKEISRSPEEALLTAATGGLYASGKASLKQGSAMFKDYQYRNGGKSAEIAMANAEKQAGLNAEAEKNNTIASESKLASARYNAGDPFTSLTNPMGSNTSRKKSILGGF